MKRSEDTAIDNGWCHFLILNGTTGGAGGLNGLHNLEGFTVIVYFAEYDVLAIEPGGDNGSDEELRSIPSKKKIVSDFAVIQVHLVDCLTCWGRHWPWREGMGDHGEA